MSPTHRYCGPSASTLGNNQIIYFVATIWPTQFYHLLRNSKLYFDGNLLAQRRTTKMVVG